MIANELPQMFDVGLSLHLRCLKLVFANFAALWPVVPLTRRPRAALARQRAPVLAELATSFDDLLAKCHMAPYRHPLL